MNEEPTDISSGVSAEEGLSARGGVEKIELDRQQAAFARRMAESKATAPHFYLGIEVEMTRALEAIDGIEATVNDLILRAVALSLREAPRVNGAYRDGQIEVYSQINPSFAVATDSSVIFPTVFNADEKSLVEIAIETKSLAKKARDGSLTAPEFSGGTFTVSNLGMHGVDSYTPILNPPQAATLGVASVKPRPLAQPDGSVSSRPSLQLDLACDHRILTGTDAAGFLAALREHLEDSSSL